MHTESIKYEKIKHSLKSGDLLQIKTPTWSFSKKTENYEDEYYRKKKVKNIFLEKDVVIMFLSTETLHVNNTFTFFYKFLIKDQINFIAYLDFKELYEEGYIKKIKDDK